MTTVRAYTWDRGKPAAVPGAMIHNRGKRVFVPLTELYTVADALVDVAERPQTRPADRPEGGHTR